MRAAFSFSGATRHGLVALAEGLVVAGIIAALLFALSPIYAPARLIGGTDQTLAARGGNGHGGGSITVPDGVFAGTTTATVNPGGSGAWALAQCYQDGTLVYAQYVEADSNSQATFTLGPTRLWTSGSANCTAEEGVWGSSGRWRTVAETTFNVSG